MTELDPEQHPPRNRWGHPIVTNPDQPTHTVTALRPSSLADTVKDHYAIQQWATRIRAIGYGRRPDLAQLAAPLDPKNDRQELERIAAEAFTAGGGENRANQGTARHTWLEKLIHNPAGTVADLPPDVAADVEAIADCLETNNIRAYTDDTGPWCERFVITRLDQYGWAAGTADLYATVRDATTPAVVDLKTGTTDPRKNPMNAATQLACYARAEWAWPHHHSPLIPTPPDVQHGVAWVLWAPAGEARAELIPLNIMEGWDTARLAAAIRQHRRGEARYRLTDGDLEPVEPVRPVRPPVTVPSLLARIRTLIEHGVDPSEIADHWPPTIPSLKQPERHTPATLEAADQYLKLHEVREGMANPYHLTPPGANK